MEMIRAQRDPLMRADEKGCMAVLSFCLISAFNTSLIISALLLK